MPDTEDIRQSDPTPTPEQLSQAATAGPQQNILAGNPAPSASAAPAPAPAKPGPEQQAAAADVAHHTMLGRAVNFLLGKQRQYVPDPQTGQPKAVDVPQKPGDLFRHILASAIIGGAAGQGTNSGIAGFTRGAAAGIAANQQADAQKRAQAQQQFENQRQVAADQREQQRADDEHIRTSAQLAQWNLNTLVEEHNLNLRDTQYLDNYNEHNEELRNQAYDHSAIDAPIPGNGQAGNGAKLQQLRISQPSLFQPPPGSHLLYTTSVDRTGLHDDPKKGWVDESGNPVKLEDRTTHYVQFVPQDSTDERITLKGSRIKKLLPDWGDLVQDDKDYTLPFKSWVGAIQQTREVKHKEAREDWRERHDEVQRQLAEVKNKADNYRAQAIAADREAAGAFDEKEKTTAQARADEFRQKEQDAYDEYDEIQAQAHPNSRIRKTNIRPTATGTGSALAPDLYGKALAAAKGVDYGTAVQQIQSDRRIPDADKQRLIREAVPAGKAAVFNQWGYVGLVDKDDVARMKKKDQELGNKAGTNYVEGPDAPPVTPSSPTSAVAASMQ